MKFGYLNKKVPSSYDFTPQAVNRALRKHASGHWTVRYSIPIFLGGVVFGALFGFTYTVFLLLLGIIGLGLFSFIIQFYFRAKTFKSEYTSYLHNLLQKQTDKKRTNLKKDLQEMKCEQGAKQMDQFQHKFDTLLEILKTKFDESQLTYSRYYSIAQEVFLSGIDNLTSILMALKTLKSIDINYINERLLALDKEKDKNMSIKKEYDALHRSLASHKEQETLVKELLAENESAMTQIDEASIAISKIERTLDKEAEIDMENSMKSLQEMTHRTKEYNR
ncbi:MAG: hypothetical protein JXB49_12540 [Bacteroidales bacterium]|nr:hypothetical protein [Bacteroidales bacterium]